MNDSAWHWARLDRKGIALVQETESALGANLSLLTDREVQSRTPRSSPVSRLLR
ncbi:MAG: hypothetical protein IPF84_02415 [Proteobacteria bacterium]|nr:hypothetical protein [Pseudomonadota bacterium]